MWYLYLYCTEGTVTNQLIILVELQSLLVKTWTAYGWEKSREFFKIIMNNTAESGGPNALQSYSAMEEKSSSVKVFIEDC